MAKKMYNPKCFPCSACGKLHDPRRMSWVKQPASKRLVRACTDCYIAHMNVLSLRRSMGHYTASMKRIHRIAKGMECTTNHQNAKPAQPTQPASTGFLMCMWLVARY